MGTDREETCIHVCLLENPYRGRSYDQGGKTACLWIQ